jgi:hypothetical protein
MQKNFDPILQNLPAPWGSFSLLASFMCELSGSCDRLTGCYRLDTRLAARLLTGQTPVPATHTV